MGKLLSIVRGLKMTSAIAARVICSIAGSIAVVSATIYLNLHERAVEASSARQTTNLGVAATILEKRVSGSTLTWTDGKIASFQGYAIPPFYGTEIIDAVTRVTGEQASIYVFGKAGGGFLSKTTSIEASPGTRAENIALASGDAAFDALMEGQPFQGASSILGVEYLGAFQPLLKKSGETMGRPAPAVTPAGPLEPDSIRLFASGSLHGGTSSPFVPKGEPVVGAVMSARRSSGPRPTADAAAWCMQ
ncbi:MAG: cache domain-containing protein [Devosia nanyangense]|uniref:Cache domain-containing protein n=1 Tax=Devosia nanyangense TaxID=1228055 RepID=A0A933L6P9_9HYPH|nr:cache domain-containing protein [Devosia nanyangense]